MKKIVEGFEEEEEYIHSRNRKEFFNSLGMPGNRCRNTRISRAALQDSGA